MQNSSKGPRLIIIADNSKTYNYGPFHGVDIKEMLQNLGWEFELSYDPFREDDGEYIKNVSLFRSKSEGLVTSDTDTDLGVSGQFYSHMLKPVLSARLEVISSDLHYMCKHTFSAASASVLCKIAKKCPDIEYMIKTFKDADKALQYVMTYFVNRYGIYPDYRNIEKCIKVVNK